MGVNLKPIASIGNEEADRILKILRSVLSDLEDQLNKRGQLYANTNGKIPTDLHRDDVLISSYRGKVSVYIHNGRSLDALTAAMLGGLSANGTNFKGFQSGTTAPNLTHFPEHGDWGFYRKTSGPVRTALAFNRNGNVEEVTLA